MGDYIFHHLKNRERVCDNNCEPNNSLAETLTDTPAFKYVDIFEGIGGLTTIPLCQYLDYCCEPFKNRNELFEVLDRLRDKNSYSTVFEENEIEKILYRMFPSDYSSSFNIDGIATDDFGKQFVLVSLDDYPNTIVTSKVDSDGMLISEEKPNEYKNGFSKERKLKKDHIRDLLKQIAILNSDINDLSIFNETTDEEYWKEKQEVCRLKEEVWKYYIGEHNEGEQYIYNQVSEVVNSVLSASNNIPKRKKRKNDYSNNAVPTKMHGRVLSQDPNPMHDYVSSVLESHDLQMCQTVYHSLVNHDYQKGHIYEDEVRRLQAKIDEMNKAIYAPRMIVKEQHNHNCQQFMGEMNSPNFITQSKG